MVEEGQPLLKDRKEGLIYRENKGGKKESCFEEELRDLRTG